MGSRQIFLQVSKFLWGITELKRIVKKQTNYPIFTNNTTFLYTETLLFFCMMFVPGTAHLKPLKFHKW